MKCWGMSEGRKARGEPGKKKKHLTTDLLCSCSHMYLLKKRQEEGRGHLPEQGVLGESEGHLYTAPLPAELDKKQLYYSKYRKISMYLIKKQFYYSKYRKLSEVCKKTKKNEHEI